MVRYKARGPRSTWWPVPAVEIPTGQRYVERLAPTWSPYVGPVRIAVPSKRYRRPVQHSTRMVGGTRHVSFLTEAARARIQELLSRPKVLKRAIRTVRPAAATQARPALTRGYKADYWNFTPEYVGPFTDVSLAGFWDDPMSYISEKWEEAKARAQALVGEFLQQRARLIDLDKQVESAIRATEGSETTPITAQRQLISLRARTRDLLADQTEIETKLTEAKRKIQAAEDALAADQLGVAPLAIAAVAAAVAAVAVVAGLVVMHTQHVNQLENELDAVIAGEVSAEDVGKIKGRGFFAGIGQGITGPVVLGLIGVGALWYLTQRKGR